MADANLILQCSGQIKAPMRLRFIFEVFCKAIALTLTQQRSLTGKL
ncbi:MAG: hypothetical protein V7K32_09005 [Nostoc sp.]